MTNTLVLFVLLFLTVNADRTEQGNLLTSNTFTISGKADGVVTINLGPFGNAPTVKAKSDKPTQIGIRFMSTADLPESLPAQQGIAALALAGSAAMEITSSNPDAKCEYELITFDLTSFLTGGILSTGILCLGCDKGVKPGSHAQSSTGLVGGPIVGGPSGSGSWDCPEVPGSFWDWRYAPPNCDALTVSYPNDLPSGQANDVNVRINAAGYGTITLNFHNNGGFWSGETTFNFRDHPNFPSGVTFYTVEWVQVGGTNCHWTGPVQCGGVGAGPSSTGVVQSSSAPVPSSSAPVPSSSSAPVPSSSAPIPSSSSAPVPSSSSAPVPSSSSAPVPSSSSASVPSSSALAPSSSAGVQSSSSGVQLGGGNWDCPEVPSVYWDWRYAPPNCDSLTVNYPTDLPAGQARDVNVRIYTAEHGDIVLNFHSNSDFSGEVTFIFRDHPDFPSDVTFYTVEWVQVGGSNCHWTGPVQCGLVGGGQGSTGVVAHSSSSTGLIVGGPTPCQGNCWSGVPCELDGGKLKAKLEQSAIYVFVSIQQILQTVFNNPCDLIAGLNRTYQWAEDFAIELKTQTQNQMQCRRSETTNLGDVQQRRRDCGEDMGHFYNIDLAWNADYESTLVYKYTEDMLLKKGKCASCGKHLRWAYWDQQVSKWKFPETPSVVDEQNRECRQKTNQMASTWAVMYAEGLSDNSTVDYSSTGLVGSNPYDNLNGADAVTMSVQVMSTLMLLCLYLIR